VIDLPPLVAAKASPPAAGRVDYTSKRFMFRRPTPTAHAPGDPVTIYREGSDSSESWSFKTNDDGRWFWERRTVEGTIILAPNQTFTSLEECQKDARTRGYDG
jgi:hypothetical protein